MESKTAVEQLKNSIKDAWTTTRTAPRGNIKRGHTRSLSTDVEDQVAAFVSDILGEGYELYIDSSVYIKQTHRPDLLVVKDRKAVALIEIKSQMGWCRDVSGVIENEILRMHKAFSEQGEITCKFSTDKSSELINYEENVKCFLVSLTSQNGGNDQQMKANKDNAAKQGVLFHVLFDGWYDDLQEKDVYQFAEMISKLKETK